MARIVVGRIWHLTREQCDKLDISLETPPTLYQSICELYWWGHTDNNSYSFVLGDSNLAWLPCKNSYSSGEAWNRCALAVLQRELGVPTYQVMRHQMSLHARADVSIRE